MISPQETVFISYSHDDENHKRRVEELATKLKEKFHVVFDQNRDHQDENLHWSLWTEKQIVAADFVLLVCTELYKKKVYQEVRPDQGYGVLWEAAVIVNQLYVGKIDASKFIPIVFSDAERRHIPLPLRGLNEFVLDSDTGYEHLVSFLKKPRGARTYTAVNPRDGQTYIWVPPGRFDEWLTGTICEEVVIESGFWIGQTPVTQAAYEAIASVNPSHFRGSDRPVEQVTWVEAHAYCEKVGLRLPTADEWKYAALAGEREIYSTSRAERFGWFEANSGNETHPVKKKEANAWGLYDCLGNVFEWTEDKVAYGSCYYSEYPQLFGITTPTHGRDRNCGFRCAGD